ncbi:hypothetical protein [Armatimonas sp.]|uniref:hypothetical protein n=1 Tax=Armatimonas sp. TaxID=1872638 RepID=UPI0037508F7D
MILDPRYFGLDNLLRRPLHQDKWGTDTLTLEILTDNHEAVLPADGHWRPSHSSLYGRAEFSELQLVQDSFMAQDGTLVATLLIRNPSSDTVFVELAPRWSLKNGLSEAGWVHRCTPPLDDLLVHLPADACIARNFTLSVAATEEAAFKNATRWFFESRPAAAHVQHFEHWCASNTLLFDCPDPWLTRLFAHCQALRWRGIAPTGEGTDPRASFDEANFDAPRDDCPAWDTLIRERLVGASVEGDVLTITPDNFLGLSSFCLQGFYNTTIVWDDPAHPTDAYEDGDKGLTIYHGRRRLYNQPTLTPVTLPLVGSSGRFRGE